MLRIGIVGASGYTGIELLKLLARHPGAEVCWSTSESHAGRSLGEVFPLVSPLAALPLRSMADVDLRAADVVFSCLPHATAQSPVAAAVSSGARVIDLSADYRLRSADGFAAWYGTPPAHPALLGEAVYGLPELHRSEIAGARLVANPGCYPTSVILGLAPLARAGWLGGTVIADSKSGVSGAGRQPSLKTHFVEANENISPYNIGHSHRHLAEMEQELHDLQMAGDYSLIFSPHLLPVNRGILSTIYASLPAGLSEERVRQAYREMYGAEPFVRLLPPGEVASLSHTVGSNYLALGLTFVAASRMLIITASLDNLIKGAAGQAVQNMNVMYGLDERMGLV